MDAKRNRDGAHVVSPWHAACKRKALSEVSLVRQLGSAVLALVIMLASAKFSEQLVPTVRSQEPARVPSIVAKSMSVTPIPKKVDAPPRAPEQLVMVAVGGILMGLGG